jgi:hypothetical protein
MTSGEQVLTAFEQQEPDRVTCWCRARLKPRCGLMDNILWGGAIGVKLWPTLQPSAGEDQ